MNMTHENYTMSFFFKCVTACISRGHYVGEKRSTRKRCNDQAFELLHLHHHFQLFELGNSKELAEVRILASDSRKGYRVFN